MFVWLTYLVSFHSVVWWVNTNTSDSNYHVHKLKNRFFFFFISSQDLCSSYYPLLWCFVSPSFLIRFTPNLEHWFIYSWSILPMIYIVENCTINLVWHILHRWLEIVIPPVAFIWFLRNLKPRNYITILINTKNLKIFWLFMWTQHVFTFWLIIHTVVHI